MPLLLLSMVKIKFLRVSRGKTCRFFPYGAFLSRVAGMFTKVP